MRPVAQERWLVCYDLEHFATNVLGYSELIFNPEYREKVPELAENSPRMPSWYLELVNGYAG